MEYKGLVEICWSGNDRMSGFLEQWGYAVDGVCDEVSEQTLTDMYSDALHGGRFKGRHCPLPQGWQAPY